MHGRGHRCFRRGRSGLHGIWRMQEVWPDSEGPRFVTPETEASTSDRRRGERTNPRIGTPGESLGRVAC